MKKSLVALAALAATSAFAQSSVTLYGVIDVAYGAKQIEGNTGVVSTGKQTGVMDGGFAGNRIGFRGTEDLGGGKAVSFTIEQGISPTNPAMFGVRTANAGFQLDGLAASTGKFDQGTGGGYSTGTNRQAFASFKDNSLGEVRVGYQYTALYEVSTLMGFTTMSEGVYGGTNTHTFGAGAAGGTRANGIQYISPRVGSFGAAIQAGSATGRDTTESVAANTATGLKQDRNKRFSLKLDYAEGPWTAAYAKTDMHSGQSARAASATANNFSPNGTLASASIAVNTVGVYGALTGVGVTPLTATDYDTSMTQLAAAYTASNWKVGVQRNSGTYTINNSANATFGSAAAITPTVAAMTAAAAYDFKSQRISGQYTVGSWDLIAGRGTATVDSGSTRTVDFKESQLGAIYNLSKTSKLYAYNGQWTDAAVTTATGAYKGKQTIVGLYKAF